VNNLRPEAPPPNAAQLRAAQARAALAQCLPPGVEPIHLTSGAANRCLVCDLEVEWEDDQLVECDKCRMLVHQHCYGIQSVPDGASRNNPLPAADGFHSSSGLIAFSAISLSHSLSRL
jgi:hypothetical protein